MSIAGTVILLAFLWAEQWKVGEAVEEKVYSIYSRFFPYILCLLQLAQVHLSYPWGATKPDKMYTV